MEKFRGNSAIELGPPNEAAATTTATTVRPKTGHSRFPPPPAAASSTAISKGTVPCLQCGGLQLTSGKPKDLVGKSGAEHSPVAPAGASTANAAAAAAMMKKYYSSTSAKNLLQSSAKENFISGLMQQIKLLELEIAYLKGNQPTTTTAPSLKGDQQSAAIRKDTQQLKKISSSGSPRSLRDLSEQNDRLRDEIRSIKSELADKRSRLEAALSEKAQLQSRISRESSQSDEERKRLLDQLAYMTGKVEQLEADLKNLDSRHQSTLAELERQAIISKDKEKRIQALGEELESSEETAKKLKSEQETLRTDLLQREAQYRELEEKFLQSSVHILEETLKGLREENRNLQLAQRASNGFVEEARDRQGQLEAKIDKLLSENAELRAELSENRQKLDSEVRAREGRENKAVLESQEALGGKERERALKNELSRLTADLEKERARSKATNEKMSREGQQITSLELRVSTQKSRIAELEGSLILAQESTNKIRKELLLQQEQNHGLENEIDLKSNEISALHSKLSQTEGSLSESERRCEALATLQSHRWMEFSKMADSMKELSSTMLTQSKTNTRKAAIRADLDEELEM